MDTPPAFSRTHTFTIGELHYEAVPCSVGKTPQGEMTANGAIRMIIDRQLNDLKILDICCGVGIVGLTIFSKLKEKAIIKEIVFADINIFNLNSLQRTLKINNLEHFLGKTIRYYLSNALINIPNNEKFDIIVSNPPHYLGAEESKTLLSPRELGTYDIGWSFHDSFYKHCHNYLAEHGEVWFLENGSVAKESDFLPFIKDNPNLRYLKRLEEYSDPHFFWMITQKV